MKILLTGCAGFIGMHTALRLLADGKEVIGVDNLNDYYDVHLKNSRLAQLKTNPNFSFHQLDVSHKPALEELFACANFDRVVHLAAQAGVRYSLVNPQAYIDANIQGFMNILENCRYYDIKHLVYASSSSVYGSNGQLPFAENQNVDHPISLYAATKKANELMAHTYSHLYNIPTTGLRFFTVYGPWGRPDMALFKFTQSILADKPIDIYNHGEMIRDFTYIDDIVEGIVRVTYKEAASDPLFDNMTPNPATSHAPYRIFNIGNNNPVPLLSYIEALENALGKPAQKNYLPMQAGDVAATASNTEALQQWIGFKPNTSITVGINSFVKWYKLYYETKTKVFSK